MSTALFCEFLDSLAREHIDYADVYAKGQDAIQAHLRMKFYCFLQLVELTG